jgi:hypothetical protein
MSGWIVPIANENDAKGCIERDDYHSYCVARCRHVDISVANNCSVQFLTLMDEIKPNDVFDLIVRCYSSYNNGVPQSLAIRKDVISAVLDKQLAGIKQPITTVRDGKQIIWYDDRMMLESLICYLGCHGTVNDLMCVFNTIDASLFTFRYFMSALTYVPNYNRVDTYTLIIRVMIISKAAFRGEPGRDNLISWSVDSLITHKNFNDYVPVLNYILIHVKDTPLQSNLSWPEIWRKACVGDYIDAIKWMCTLKGNFDMNLIGINGTDMTEQEIRDCCTSYEKINGHAVDDDGVGICVNYAHLLSVGGYMGKEKRYYRGHMD